MAPAAKANMYGRTGINKEASNMTANAPTGSTAPLNDPITNDFHLELPAVLIGMDMMAPSGTFWMAMPSDHAIALAREIFEVLLPAPANTTPTAMPSGRL